MNVVPDVVIITNFLGSIQNVTFIPNVMGGAKHIKIVSFHPRLIQIKMNKKKAVACLSIAFKVKFVNLNFLKIIHRLRKNHSNKHGE